MAFVSNLALAYAEVVRAHGTRPALVDPVSGDTLATHAELQARAGRIAAALHARGLRRGQVVALFHDKGVDGFAAMHACLRLGLPYVNLDADSPWERLRRVLATCRPALVLSGPTSAPHAAALAEAGHACAHIGGLAAAGGDPAALPPAEDVGGGTPAYVMFTSGSTGMPKGAVISHANLLWFAAWTRDRFAITPDDRLTNVNPIYFDNSVFDFYAAMLAGAALVPFPAALVRDARQLVAAVDRARCTLWFSVPSLLVYLLTMRALGPGSFASVRTVAFGGEGFPKPRLRELWALLGDRCAVENVYGPTECTCICSAHRVTADDLADESRALVTLGTLAQNFDHEILPQPGAAPAGDGAPEVGELFLRGPQVGLGYWGDPERSARSFVQNPRHRDYADIGYRTGDLVERDAQGRLHFRGRIDFQIKHMGYRIELEEIEAALAQAPGVAECAVVYQRSGEGLGRIVAFAAAEAGAPADAVRDAATTTLAERLPAYMQPRLLNLLPVLPKNANGKIDRVALLLSLGT